MTNKNAARDKRNFLQTIKEARIGHPEAQYEVGLMFANGVGVEQDFGQAVYWVRQSAERGFAAAQYLLATRYLSGEVIEQDDYQALLWLLKAADQGNAKAVHKLGRFLAAAHPRAALDQYLSAAKLGVAGAQFDLASLRLKASDLSAGALRDAFLWCEKAAQQGVVAAQCLLGDLYATGRGVDADVSLACEWYQVAARQYSTQAQVALSMLQAQPAPQRQGVPLRSEGVGQQDHLKWEHAAEGGDAAAKYCLGLMYQNGWGVAQDVHLEKYWFGRAATLGHQTAMFELAMQNELDGNCVQAFRWHLQLADQKFPASCSALGRFYSEGLGTSKNDYLGVLWTMMAAELGDLDSVNHLTRLCHDEPSRLRLAWLEKAAQHGNMDAQYELGVHCAAVTGEAVNVSACIRWYQLAAEQGHAQAQCALGMLLLAVPDGLGNVDVAWRWLLKAAEQGCATAEWNMALLLIAGRHGIKKNLKQAFAFCQQAAQRGLVPAQATLGNLYFKMKKPEIAVEWWTLAAQAGDPEAQFNLGNAYLKASGANRDVNLAVLWMGRAAEQGVASAQSKMGVLLATGVDMVEDPVEAHKWFVLASQKADASAKANLQRSLQLLTDVQVAEANRRARVWNEVAAKNAPKLPSSASSGQLS